MASYSSKRPVSTNEIAFVVPKIYFASRTHSQIKQVVKELKNTSYRPTMAVLASRDHYCIHPLVMKKPNKNDECQKLLTEQKCLYFRQVNSLVANLELKRNGSFEVWDIEDLIHLGQSHRACPYFTSRSIATDADLILCPYNYLIDPIIRKVKYTNIQIYKYTNIQTVITMIRLKKKYLSE